jgi:predicted RecB family nuclease
MRKNAAQKLVFSPSDLIVAMRSPFASWMDRLLIEAPHLLTGIQKEQDPLMALLATRGHQHESDFLKQLQVLHGADRVALVGSDAYQDQSRQTLHYIKKGYSVIYQAYLTRENFAGHADFLIKVDGASRLGNYHYEIWDTKLASTTRPYFLIQLCCYSWMLAAIQDVLPQEAAIILGSQQEKRFRIAQYYSYYQRLQRDFMSDQKAFVADLSTLPDPTLDCDHGP